MIKRDDAPEPCPFCKCEEVTTWFDREQGEKWGYASCDGCAARGPEVRTNWDREPDAPWHSEAIAAWNARAINPAARYFDDRAMLRCIRLLDVGDPAKARAAILALIGEKK